MVTAQTISASMQFQAVIGSGRLGPSDTLVTAINSGVLLKKGDLHGAGIWYTEVLLSKMGAGILEMVFQLDAFETDS